MEQGECRIYSNEELGSGGEWGGGGGGVGGHCSGTAELGLDG